MNVHRSIDLLCDSAEKTVVDVSIEAHGRSYCSVILTLHGVLNSSRMSRRAPLLQQQLESSVHAMAPATASAATALWQRCVGELRGRLRFLGAASARVDAGAEASAAVVKGTLRGTGLGRVSEQSILLSSFSWGRAAVARASCTAVGRGRVWCLERHHNFAASGSSISSWEHFCRVNAMPLSTVPAREQHASEGVPTESVTSKEAVVADGEASLELEFAPEIESTPSTPLVQAIHSLEETISAEVSSSSHDQILRNVFADTEIPTAGAQALLEADSDRVVDPGRIYIGGLPFRLMGDELRDELRELCGKYGTVTDINLAQHRNQSQKSIALGKHRGFAFVTMETPEQAQEVIDKLNGTSAWGRVLMVSHGLKKIEPDPSEKSTSKDIAPLRCKVFVGNLHEGTSREDLATKFLQFGTVVDVKLITELHSHRSRGFGFVTFAEEGQAIKAVLDCDGSILDGSVIRVNIAKYPQGY